MAIPVLTQRSRGMAITLMAVDALYLFFERRTHADVFNEESQQVAIRLSKNAARPGAVYKSLAVSGGTAAAPGRARTKQEAEDVLAYRAVFNDELVEPPEPRATFLRLPGRSGHRDDDHGLQHAVHNGQHPGAHGEGLLPRDFIGMNLLSIPVRAVPGRRRVGMRIDDIYLLFDGIQVSALFVSLLLAQ